ncbi:CD109 antigen [Lepisosteus oculatus]|uniref:CD109 antigen n=1 Tax=Lepisosteus oculatus TaxID=7918 RepID=UPI0035F5178C
MMRLKVFVIYGILVISGRLQNTVASPSYLITAPRFLRPAVPSTLTVALLRSPPDFVKIMAEILSGNFSLVKSEATFKGGSIGILEIPSVPKEKLKDKAGYQLVVSGYVQNKLVFTNKTELEFNPKSFSIFIQTDRPKYKPGQSVKIRAVSVYPDLKPSKSQVDIGIKDPQGNLIQQWLSLDSRLGVVSQEFHLSENPPLGTWSIEASGNGVLSVKNFIVAEYVVPTFEVLIQTPSVFNYEDGVSGTVTAKYTYGKPVKGVMTVTVLLNYFNIKLPLNKTMEIDGLATFNITYKDFADYDNLYAGILEAYFPDEINVLITASVSEHLTGITQSTTLNTTAVRNKYQLNFYGYPFDLKPSLNFTTYLKISSYKPLTPEERRDNVTISIRKYRDNYWDWGIGIFQSRTNNFSDFSYSTEVPSETYETVSYMVPENGIIAIRFQLPEKIYRLSIQAQLLRSFEILDLYQTYQSPSKSYIQLKKDRSDLKVGIPFRITVESSNPLKELHYLVTSRGKTLSVGKLSNASFTLIPEESWAPLACIIVYYVRDDGEIINDALNLPIANVFKNKVSLRWSKAQTEPSDKVTLDVSAAEPNSLVGLLVVDKGTQLLGSGNDITQDTVTEELTTYNGEEHSYLPKMSIGPFSVFMSCNLVVITDANLSDDIEGYKPEFFEEILQPFESKAAQPLEPRVRSNFPETWIWMDFNTSASRNGSLTVTVPDSITSWIASAFVISENLGFGLSTAPANLEVFQSFFLSLNLPYSVIRGEKFILEVIIFNYLEQPLEVMVTVAPSASFDFLFPDVEGISMPSKQKVSVASRDGTSVLFPIKPKALGEIPISVKAISSVASDAVIQKVLVKPEGIEQSFAKSLFLDLALAEQSVSKQINFTFPPNVVQGSERAYFTVFGDILGPSITGLESLIQMPYGCGEQNMINFAPNIYVLQYLINTHQVKEDIRSKAISFMVEGYQRELSYQRKDGSFSAFGNSDSSGSTWLSAFVLRCFLEARPFISIDPKVLSSTVSWLLSQQDASGEFKEPGRVIHTELQGGQNGPVSLTAYVLMALLEDDTYTRTYSSAIDKALDFLKDRLRNGVSSSYALCLVTYALSLKYDSGARDALDELVQRVHKQGDTLSWDSTTMGLTNSWQARSTDIEISAYVMLSYFKQSRVAEGVPFMKWLSQQRSHLGGYSSTQDTIIALKALSEYAVYTGSGEIEIMVKVTAPGLPTAATFQIDSTNFLLLQRQEIKPQKEIKLSVSAEGRGFAIFQLNVFYNLKSESSSRRRRDTENNEAFDLEIEVNDHKDDLNHVSLHICTRLLENQNVSQTGMAIMEVGFLSGFALDESGIATTEVIKKVETSPGKVNLYLDSVTAQEFCVDIPAMRDSKIANAQDAVVQIYDYYEPRRKVVRTYNSEVMRSVSTCAFCGEDCSLCKASRIIEVTTSGTEDLFQHFGRIVLFGFFVHAVLILFQ